MVGQPPAVHKDVEEEEAAGAQPGGDAAEQLRIVLEGEVSKGEFNQLSNSSASLWRQVVDPNAHSIALQE